MKRIQDTIDENAIMWHKSKPPTHEFATKLHKNDIKRLQDKYDKRDISENIIKIMRDRSKDRNDFKRL